MARRKGTDIPKKSVGRQFIPMDWEKIDRLLEAGCSGMEIAASMGFHEDTLYNRCMLDKKKLWTDYSAEKHSKGDSLLRSKQFQQAMKGDRGMLIWLGKQRLKQRENLDQNFFDKTATDAFEKLVSEFQKMRNKE